MQNVELVDPRELKQHSERGLFKTVPDVNSGTYLRKRPVLAYQQAPYIPIAKASGFTAQLIKL